MENRPKVLLIITLDTKELEARFIRQCLEANGLEVYHLDASVRPAAGGGADITPEQIAAAAGTTMEEVRALNHEAMCLEVMIRGAVPCARELDARVGLSGIIGAGGALGTALATAVMRAFPFGLPKVMISTLASGMTRPFVGTKDIVMFNSICDVLGLNSRLRRVFENAALAISGMAHGYRPFAPSGKPLVLISTLSVTEKCCDAVRRAMEYRGCEVMVFHTSGTGGITMDEIVREQEVSVVINLSLIEVSDYLSQGLFSGGPDRCKASLEKGVPTIFAPGCIDIIVAGPEEDAKARYPGRRYHVHNASLTAVRSGAEDFKRVAEHMAGLIRKAKGPVAFFVPLRGFSRHDSEQGHLHDLSLPPVFSAHLRSVLPEGVPVVDVDCHINDAPFAQKIIEQAIAFQGGISK
ncbi:MAG: Tm-1-like ATP-binding domain-containing protein [Acidobacteriota bacterium]|nr:Tm-1-like ATP-binding domain-containing protein [Acidobacteriota bacterium]